MSASQQWLNFCLDTVGNLVVLIVGILVVIFNTTKTTSISGLIMTYVLAVVQIIPGIVSQTAAVESCLVTVERMLYYGEHIPTEEADDDQEEEIPPDWPQHGKILIKDVDFRYRQNLSLALKGLTLAISPGEKIGIIGRTGAGKSSIISILFRLFPIQKGNIWIDNINIANVHLPTLRSKLTIIPQDPTFFQGTVRSNLDPFGEQSAERLNHALHKARLSYLDLDREVMNHGNNFSHGERQLLALARAIVQDAHVVLLDEATSAIDLDTDYAVQRTIGEAFCNRTIICITHRLQTIVHYDRICMIDQGKVVAIETPAVLYEKNAVFQALCEKNGITAMHLI